MPRKHLVIPDAHDQPEIIKRRFKALGKFIKAEKPDVVVCLGDFASMDSLSSYDKGKKSHEGRRYQKDIKSANEALDLIEKEIQGLRIKKVLTWGNHENRIDRAVNSSAELEGTMAKDDIKFKEYGWSTHEFLAIVPIDGIHYTHYFPTGISGKPIGGENPAANILKKHYVSGVAGHSHIYDYAERTRPDGTKINGLVAGCYCNHNMDYAANTEHMWWAGITVLDDVRAGDYDIRRVSLRRLLDMYG